MASFGESFVDAYLAGKQMHRQDEEDRRKKKLEADLAAAVRPGDVIGPKGRAPSYDASRFSTDQGVDISNRALSDFQPTPPAPPPPTALPPSPPAGATSMSPAAQLPAHLAGGVGMVRPTGLAGGPPAPQAAPQPAPAAMPTQPLGQLSPSPGTFSRDPSLLPDPSKMVFYRDPTTGKGMAVEKGQERAATDADAAISAASIYMAHGDPTKATGLMREAYALREASFKDEQITLKRALISAGVQHGGMTPEAIAQFADVYNDKVHDGVRLTPSVGPDGKIALGLGSDSAATPMLWVNPADGSMSKTPVYSTGGEIGSYLNTLITGDYAGYQANVVQLQTAAAAAARAERITKATEDSAALQREQFDAGAPKRTADVDYTRANTRQTDAATQVALSAAGLSSPSSEDLFSALVQQESSGRPGILGRPTQYGQAQGATQMLPQTAQAMAGKLGLPWRPELMTGTTPEAEQYQLRLGRAYFDEGMAKYPGDIRKALMYYHGGPDERIWGPATRAYADAVMAHAGSAPLASSAPLAVQKAVLVRVNSYAAELRANQGLSYADSMAQAEEEVVSALPAEQRRYFEVAAPAAAPTQGIPTVVPGMTREQATAEVIRRRQTVATARADAAQRGTAAGPGHGAPPGQTRRKSAFEPLLGSD